MVSKHPRLCSTATARANRIPATGPGTGRFAIELLPSLLWSPAPQQNTVPEGVVTAQVNPAPVASALIPPGLTTPVGNASPPVSPLVTVPLPSAPSMLSPQQNAVPAAVRPQVCRADSPEKSDTKPAWVTVTVAGPDVTPSLEAMIAV